MNNGREPTIEHRPAFRVDENGDLIVASRYGIEYRIVEQIIAPDDVSYIAIYPPHWPARVYDPQPARFPGGKPKRRRKA